MNSFDRNQELERKAWAHLKWVVHQNAEQYVSLFDGSSASKGLQLAGFGDVLALFPDPKKPGERKVTSVEMKCEQADKYDNFFLEEHSNLAMNGKDGWMFTSKADRLWYYFYDEQRLHIMDMKDLQAWFVGMASCGTQTNNMRFDQKLQRRYGQMNKTVGRCVPIEVVFREVGFAELRRNGDGTFGLVRNKLPKPNLLPSRIPNLVLTPN